MITQRLQESLRFWWGYIGALLLVTAPFSLLGEVWQWWQGAPMTLDDQGQITAINGTVAMGLLLLRVPADGTLIAQLGAIQNDGTKGLGECLKRMLAVLPVLFATWLIMGVIIYAGLLALILPGIWLYVRLGFAPFLVVLEKASPMDAVRGSFMRTAEQQWTLLLTLLLAVMLVLLISAPVTSLIALLGENRLATALAAVITGLMGALVQVVFFRFYTLDASKVESSK
jgi:hypothetical protein